MITVVATIRIKAGKMDEAKEILKDIVPKVKASEPGTIEYIPHTVRGDDTMILSLIHI